MTKIQDIRGRTPFGNPKRDLSQIKYIVRHHSATPDGNFDSFIKHWQGVRGWITGGYHEIILRDGTVQLCYDPEQVTNGVLNMNTICYHICLVGNGSFTDEQEKAWDERVAYNMDRLGVDVNNVKGHGELQSTSCPGIDMDIVRGRIKGETSTYKPGETQIASESTKPNKAKPSTTQKFNLAIDGSLGPATTRALQTYLGTAVDGIISGQYNNNTTKAIPSTNYGPPFTGSNVIRALQRLIGAKADGFIGPKTVRRLQEYLGTPQDGIISRPSLMVKELQRRLNAGNL